MAYIFTLRRMLCDAALRISVFPATARELREKLGLRLSALGICTVLMLLCSTSTVFARPLSAPADSLHKRLSLPADSLENIAFIPLEAWVIPSSIRLRVNGRSISGPGVWRYDARRNRIIIEAKNALREASDGITLQLHISYKRWPTSLRQAYFNRALISGADSAGVAALLGDSSAAGAQEVQFERRSAQQDLFGDTQLQRSGSISRGLTLGSDQDASLESGLRFELSGNITEDIELTASLTDQNTPIQPDGSTQNLREFDTIFMRLRHEKGQL
ncbi:MAG: hypothetical protein ACOC2C_04225, partial [Cyclonatronaceae bacterium]